ncbi:MAG: T9SS type A sorting domain-containing protein [candidate division WOR-3 bacterium]
MAQVLCYTIPDVSIPLWTYLYSETEEKDGEVGLIARFRGKTPPKSYTLLGGENASVITDYREGYIVYDSLKQGKSVDTASVRLSYTFIEIRDSSQYNLGLVFYHQEPDTQALRVIIYADTYAVYVPPQERYYWEVPTLAQSPISFTVEKENAARAFLSEAYLFTVDEARGGPQSQDPGGLIFSFNIYPTVSKNRFNIQLVLPVRQDLDISLYDVTGRTALSLASGVYAPGTYNFTIEPSQLSSGIYYLRLISPKYRETRKLILTK